jgi:glycosyltransferase involved in cell wall biosynthesis
MNNSLETMVEAHDKQYSHLNIALVTETFSPEINGVAMTLGRIVDGLLHRNHTVQLIRPKQSNIDAPSNRERLDEKLVKGYPIPLYNNLHFGLPSKHYLIKLWKKNRPDIVHVATEGPLGLSAVSAARALNLPVTSSFHTNFQNYSKHYGIGLLKSAIEAYLLRLHNRTMATMVPTQAMVKTLQNRGYRNLTVLSRGVAIEQFSPKYRSTSLRETWGVSDTDIVVLYVGRLAKEKNVELVLTSFKAIQSTLPNAKLVFVGDGPLTKTLQSTCPEAIFAGVRVGAELAEHYASGDLFMFPSITETFGNVVSEALASGLAVVAYDYAAAENLIIHGYNGFVVPLDDEAQFIQTAIMLANDSNKQETARRNASPSVQYLDWGSVCDTFVGTLRSIIKTHKDQQALAKSTIKKLSIIQPNA